MEELPRECYSEPTGEQFLHAENKEDSYVYEKFDWTGEVKVYIKNAQFPYKVFVNAKILFATNVVKSLFIESVKLLSQPVFIPATVLTVLSTKRLEKLLMVFNRQAWRVLSPHILKDKHLTASSREFQLFIFSFLVNLQISEEVADRFASIFVHLFEYDNAYRLRLVDIMSETTLERLYKPRTEIKRLMSILCTREQYESSTGLLPTNVNKKIEGLINVASVVLLVPKYKKAFINAVNSIDLKNLQYDESDIYWTNMRTDYQFRGMTFKERMQDAESRGWTYPSRHIEPVDEGKLYWYIGIHTNGRLEILGRKFIKKPKTAFRSLKEAQKVYKEIENKFNRLKDKKVKEILLPLVAKPSVT